MRKQLSKQTSEGFLTVNISTERDYFSITGDLYETARKSERCFICGGCIHETILEHFPQLEPIVKLHLSDIDGVPMYAVENGFYFWQISHGIESPYNGKRSEDFTQILKDHLRINNEQFLDLEKRMAENQTKLEFSVFCRELRGQWKKEAEACLSLIESL